MNCFILKNTIKKMTFVSVGTPSRTIKEIIDNYSEFQKLYEILPSDIRGKSKIFIKILI